MIVSDIFQKAVEVLGFSDETKVFDRISDAVEALANKSSTWSGLEGYVDICVGCNNIVALPWEIETPLGVNIGGLPARSRGRWFEFHLNGPGSNNCPCDWVWDDRGEVPTIQDILTPSPIIAISEKIEDDNALLRVYGYEKLANGEERPIQSYGPEKPIVNRYLTASFVQPTGLAPVTIAINSSEGFLKNQELIVWNSTTMRPNYYRIKTRPDTTHLGIVQSDFDANDPAGTVFPITPELSQLKQREFQEGMQIPVKYGYPLIDEDLPKAIRVTRIIKPRTVGNIRVVALDSGREEGTLLAYMYSRVTESVYRRIRITRGCEWVRIRYRKRRLRVESMDDQILTDSVLAVKTMIQSLDYFQKNDYDNAKKYEAQALQFITEKEDAQDPPQPFKPMVNSMVGLSGIRNFS